MSDDFCAAGSRANSDSEKYCFLFSSWYTRRDPISGRSSVAARNSFTHADWTSGATLTAWLRISASAETSTIYNATTALTPKFAAIAASSSGDNTLVSGVASKTLRVLTYVLMSNGTVNAKFQSSTGGDLTGLLYLVANTGASASYAPTGHFETVAGEDLQLNLSAAIAVGGHFTYLEV